MDTTINEDNIPTSQVRTIPYLGGTIELTVHGEHEVSVWHRPAGARALAAALIAAADEIEGGASRG